MGTLCATLYQFVALFAFFISVNQSYILTRNTACQFCIDDTGFACGAQPDFACGVTYTIFKAKFHY